MCTDHDNMCLQILILLSICFFLSICVFLVFTEDRTHNSWALNIHKYWAYCIPYTLKRSPDIQLPFVRNHYLHCYIEVIAENTKREKYMYRELLSIRMLFHWDLTSKFPIQGTNFAVCFVGASRIVRCIFNH